VAERQFTISFLLLQLTAWDFLDSERRGVLKSGCLTGSTGDAWITFFLLLAAHIQVLENFVEGLLWSFCCSAGFRVHVICDFKVFSLVL